MQGKRDGNARDRLSHHVRTPRRSHTGYRRASTRRSAPARRVCPALLDRRPRGSSAAGDGTHATGSAAVPPYPCRGPRRPRPAAIRTSAPAAAGAGDAAHGDVTGIPGRRAGHGPHRHRPPPPGRARPRGCIDLADGRAPDARGPDAGASGTHARDSDTDAACRPGLIQIRATRTCTLGAGVLGAWACAVAPGTHRGGITS